jgi:Na+/H+ antiporter NhaC
MSPAIIALILIPIGVIGVMFISGFQIFQVLSPGTEEEVTVLLKQNGVCIIEASDKVPRQINNCQYEAGDQIVITFKNEQPAIESHRPV